MTPHQVAMNAVQIWRCPESQARFIRLLPTRPDWLDDVRFISKALLVRMLQNGLNQAPVPPDGPWSG